MAWRGEEVLQKSKVGIAVTVGKSIIKILQFIGAGNIHEERREVK